MTTPSATRSGFNFGFGFGSANAAIIEDCEEFAFLCDVARKVPDPVTFQEIQGRPDKTKWIAAMDSEMNSLINNKTWTLVDLPTDAKSIKCRWIFKTKFNADGQLEKYKARLVAKGFTQRPGIDYNETFAPVVRYSSIRILIAYAVHQQMTIHQMDVQTAFLHGDIEKKIFMQQPEGFDDKSGLVCLLQKSLYGLKQSTRNDKYIL